MLDVLLHHRCGGSDHPAVLWAARNAGANLRSFRRVPYLLETHSRTDVAHALFPVTLLESVAGVDLAVGIEEEIHASRLARQHALSTLNVVDQSQVEKGAEPRFRAVLLQETIDQMFEIGDNFVLVGDEVVALVEIV